MMAEVSPTGKTIGQMNGQWAVGLRFMLLSYPVLLASLLGSTIYVVQWVSKMETFRVRTEDSRFTAMDAMQLRQDISGRITTETTDLHHAVRTVQQEVTTRQSNAEMGELQYRNNIALQMVQWQEDAKHVREQIAAITRRLEKLEDKQP